MSFKNNWCLFVKKQSNTTVQAFEAHSQGLEVNKAWVQSPLKQMEHALHIFTKQTEPDINLRNVILTDKHLWILKF